MTPGVEAGQFATRQLAAGVRQLRIAPHHMFNVYLVDGVVVDAATRRAARRIVSELEGHVVHAMALTHAHPDHQGSSHAVCTELDIPLWVGAGDAGAMERGDFAPLLPDTAATRRYVSATGGPGHPVARRLREGDRVGSFTVLELPGHSPGHIALWREDDRTLLLGDVLVNLDPLTGRSMLAEPPASLTLDPIRNRRSIERAAALEPELVCFGHGPPIAGRRAFGDGVRRLLARRPASDAGPVVAAFGWSRAP